MAAVSNRGQKIVASGFVSSHLRILTSDDICRCRRRCQFAEMLDPENKVITTMVISPLDDPTRCAQSVVADLRPLRLGYAVIGMSSFGSPPMYSY